jgi:hypothetical protein
MFGIVRKRRVARPRQDCGRVPAEQRIEREAQPSSASAAELAQILLSLSLSLSQYNERFQLLGEGAATGN